MRSKWGLENSRQSHMSFSKETGLQGEPWKDGRKQDEESGMDLQWCLMRLAGAEVGDKAGCLEQVPKEEEQGRDSGATEWGAALDPRKGSWRGEQYQDRQVFSSWVSLLCRPG